MSKLPEFIGDYKVVSELGRGAMGVVYLCEHPHLGRQLAVKVMAAPLADEPDFVERFRREGVTAAKLRHPHIVQVYDQSSRDGVFYIAMEYLGSRTLRDLLRESGPMSVPDACRLMDQLLSALEHAHAQSVVHRDIKPSNIMVTDQGQVALTDFSIAFSAASEKMTRTGMALGTPEYMAPEQFDGKTDARSDLYAVGIILYEMLTGFTPFQAPTLTEVMKKQVLLDPEPLCQVDFTIPEAISRWTTRALSKDPGQRFSSASEMRQALQAATQAPPVADTIRVEPAPVPPPPTRLNPAWALGLLALLGLGVAALKPGGQALTPTPTARATTLASPTPAAVAPRLTPTPVPEDTPLMASSTPSPQPETAYRADQVDSDTPEMPAQADIRPGQGVGEVNLGDSLEQVESLWGPPYQGNTFESTVVWAYSGSDAEATLYFDQNTSKLQKIEVAARGFTLQEAPELSVGVDQEAVLKRFADPTTRDNGTLDYAALGIFFEFNTRSSRSLPKFGDHMCQSITIYEPGHSPVL
ncbi:serine/threonine protein kinase [bacterium]|nr:serine/threonine protein kinase [bacterium]